MGKVDKIQLTKLRIFVGCPGDVADERAIVEKVITSRVIKKYAEEHRFVLEVVHGNYVAPAAGIPQQKVFDQFPTESWDIFVGILWHRFGTPTGVIDAQTGTEYNSGTEQEFKAAYNANKTTGSPLVMFYRCKRAVDLDDIDSAQSDKVKEFFKSAWDGKSEHKMFIKEFDSTKATDKRSFEEIFHEDLMYVIGALRANTDMQGDIQEENQPLPPVSTLPSRTDFFGRETELHTVADAINPSASGWGILIDAIGGMGKTALATEAAHRAMNAGLFKTCVFVTAKQNSLAPTGIRAEDADAIAVDGFINETARALRQPGIAQMAGAEKRQALLALLRQMPTLLVYDNLETLADGEQKALEHFVGNVRKGSKAILTSRREGAGTGTHLPLGKLGWGAAEQIIGKEVEKDGGLAAKLNKHTKRWKELYDETYGSPLALMHILGLMRVRRTLNFDGALGLLKTKEGIDARIDFMFSEARKELNDNDKAVMFALVYFVPSATLEALAAVTQLEKRELDDAIDHLANLCLLDILQDADRYALHPLTREFAQKEMDSEPGVAYEKGMNFAKHWLTYSRQCGGNKPESHKTYPLVEAEWPNIDAATKWLWKTANVTDATVGNEGCAILLNDFANVLSKFLLYNGRWDERIIICGQVYLAMKLLGDEFHAGWRAYNISYVLVHRGDMEGAENWCDEAVAAWKVGGSKGDEAEGLRWRGVIARKKGDEQNAEGYQLDALKIYRELGNKDNLAPALNSLAVFYDGQKKYDKAEPYYKEAIEKTADKGDKALYLYNFGLMEIDRKNWEIAEQLFQQSLQLAEMTNRQQTIAGSCYGLAQVNEHKVAIEQALQYAERALEIREKLLDEDLQITRNLVARLREKVDAAKA